MKTYPVIIYPKIILRFLANNPLPMRSEIPSQTQKTEVPKEAVKSQKSSIFLRLGIISGLLVFCWSWLSPTWLVALAWGLMGFGWWSMIGVKSRRQAYRRTRRRGEGLTSESLNSSVPLPLRSWIREQQIKELLNAKVLVPARLSQARQGLSEKRFFHHLKAFFPNIQQGVEFDNPQFCYPYSADFILTHESGVSLDIEIDEPYVGDSKQPHHAIDQGKDDLRNHFFTQQNWIVVRFCEEQVVRYPLSCAKAIASVLEQVCGDRRYLEQFQGVPDLPPLPMWTIKQAHQMAGQNYRQTYLILARS